METIAIALDGVPVSGRQGMTILELAQEVGVDIPTLCHDPCLKPVGACRVCLVEEETSQRLLASCVTPIASGMRIRSRSPRVLDTRRVVVKLLLANHAESCVVCDKGNRCQLRQLAAELGIGRMDYDRMPSYVDLLDLNPFLVRDLSKCILCAKCIRADHELVVVGALDYIHRGFDARPATLGEGSLESSECIFCGTCVAVCPTGALMEKGLPHLGTVGRRIATICPFCGCGCSLWVHARENRLVQVTPRWKDSTNGATLCVRGHYGGDHIHHPDRLLYPQIRKDGELRAVPWEEALDQVAEGLKEVVRKHGAGSVGFFGSSQCTNEENYLFQKLARLGVGTPHLDNGARFQAISSVLGLRETLGVGAATNPLEDLEGAQVILVVGGQPLESHPVAGFHIKRAVRYRGARLIHAGPLDDGLSRMAETHLRVMPGGELPLVLGLMRTLALERGVRPQNLHGKEREWSILSEFLEGLDPSALESLSGVDGETMRAASAILSTTRRCAIVLGGGLSQSPGGVAAVRALAHLAVLLGCVGVGGGGIFPLDRGANTQGACDMGSLPEWLPGYRPVDDPTARAAAQRVWGKEPPEGPGWTFCEMVQAARRGELKALYLLGENPLPLLPREAREALNDLELLVVQELFHTPCTAVAHVVFPGAGFAEKDGTYTNVERRIQRIRSAMDPPGEARPDWWILAELLRRMAPGPEYDTPADVMKEIGEMIPEYRGAKYSRLEAGRISWPCADEGSTGEGILFRGGVEGWKVDPSGLLLETARPQPDSEYPWTAVQGEPPFHWGGCTRSGKSRRLAGFRPDAQVLLHEQDMASGGLSEGDEVRLVSPHGEMKGVVRFGPEIPQGVVWVVPGAGGCGFPDLAAWDWDPESRVPLLRVARVRAEKAGKSALEG